MADRILTWYIETPIGDGTSQGPVYTADQDYTPHVTRIHVKRAPDAGVCEYDIKDDGVSIFTRDGLALPSLAQNQTAEDVAEDWPMTATPIDRYSAISCDLTGVGAGASGITIQLELATFDGEDEKEYSDT